MSETLKAGVPKFRRYRSEERAAMLVEAGLACLAEGGITAFTVENICNKSGASRGLIAHHFGGKDGLLAAVYAAAYAPLIADLKEVEGLAALLDCLVSPRHFTRELLNIWLALWGEAAVNPALQAAHRAHYALFRTALARAIAAEAPAADAEALAMTVIALVDGLWLELCIAPDLMSADRARALCEAVLAAQGC
jgi:TetR/AcrR family transcriptional regulator, transcriptional repressor of bet genes